MDDYEPRAWTREEMQQLFLDQIRVQLEYWLHEERTAGTRRKLEGLAFSILVILDGDSALPKHRVIPTPHPDDRKDHEQQGDNWYPEGVDISGELHERWPKYCQEGR